jgi:hypothetical protein
LKPSARPDNPPFHAGLGSVDEPNTEIDYITKEKINPIALIPT